MNPDLLSAILQRHGVSAKRARKIVRAVVAAPEIEELHTSLLRALVAAFYLAHKGGHER